MNSDFRILTLEAMGDNFIHLLIRRNLGMADASDGEVFARLRQMKDVF